MQKLTVVLFCLILFVSACRRDFPSKSIYHEDFSTRTVGSTLLIKPGTHDHHHRYLRRGWSLAEGEGTWCSDLTSRLIFNVLAPRPFRLTIRARPLPDLTPPQTFSIRVNDHHAGDFTMADDFDPYSVDIPGEYLKTGWNLLTLEFSRIDRPSNLGLGPDNRHLAALVESIRFTPAGNRAPAEEEIPDGRNWYPPESMLLLTVEDYQQLEGILDISAPKHSGKTTVRLIIDQDRGNTFTHEEVITLSDHKQLRFSQPLQPCFPARLRVINTSDHPIHIDGIIRDPHPLGTPVQATSPKDFAEHVVVVVPDAFAADYLGCYGHPESSTPFMDRLALNGRQYTDVYSSASYTVTSVAGMLTGGLPSYHGVRQIGERIPDNVVLLPEKLKEQGYRTMAFSCMPTVAAAWNFNQGFEHFIEFFQSRDDPVNSMEIVDRIVEKDPFNPSQPFFTYIHLREPHAPYAPGELFRVWAGEPPAHYGDIETLRRLDEEGIAPDSRELSWIRNLYLGHTAALDRTVEILYRHAAESVAGNLRFVVLSDHGEAFGEHGRLTHNSTIYREMIRVPAIAFDSGKTLKSIDEGLRSNMNLESFLLREPGPETSRYIWQRSAGNDWYFTGITGKRFRYMHGGYYPVSELYDRVNDPGEQINVSEDFPVTRDHLESIRSRLTRIEPGTNIVEKPQSAMHDKLKALGYIE